MCTVSSRPGFARPVRTCDSCVFSAAIVLSMWSCACFLMSEMVFSAMRLSSFLPASRVDERAFVFAHHHAAQRAVLHDREDLDRQLLVAAQRKGRRVHDAE